MDPNIMKLLEDDEDDTMHSGADVEAFAAALNRDIEGDNNNNNNTNKDTTTSTTTTTSTSPQAQAQSQQQQKSLPSDNTTTTTGVLPEGSNSTSNQLFTQGQDTNQDENVIVKNKDEVKRSHPQDQKSSEMEMMQHGSASENQEQHVGCSQEHSQLQSQQKDGKLQSQQKDDHIQPQQKDDQIQSQEKDDQLLSQQKDDKLQRQVEQNPHQYSQKSGFQTTEQSLVRFGEQERMRQSEKQHQYPSPQNTNNQQTPPAESENRNKQVSFGMLLPVIIPHLDKDRAMQLQTLYSKLRKNEIHKDGFVRHMRNIVGDQMLRQAVHKIQMQQTKTQAAPKSQTVPHQLQAQSQASSQQQQQVNMPSLNASHFTDSLPFSQLHQKGHRAPTDPTQVPTAPVEVQKDSNFPARDSNALKRESEHQSDSKGMHVNQVSSSSMSVVNQERDLPGIKGLNKQQQQHLHLPQTSYPMYGANMSNYHAHPYTGQSVGASSTSLKPQTQDSQIRQVSLHQGMVPTQSGGTTQPVIPMGVQNYEIQTNDPKRLHGGSFSHLTTQSTLQHDPVSWQLPAGKDNKGNSLASIPYIKQEVPGQSQEQHLSRIPASLSSTSFGSGKIDQGNPAPPGNPVSVSMPIQSDSLVPVRSQVPSITTSLGPGTNIKTPPKKLSIGQKKPLDAVGAPSALASKKQKVTGAFLDQSIEQLNDVTTVSGVNLREEEEQLFSGSKEESRASEATRRVVQEEEERLILQKIPLQKKLAKIMSKCGIKNVNKDVERCLSLCLEERMRGMISNLIRVSKQRVDNERSRHRTIITSDVRRQILVMNRKAKDEYEKKQAEEAEKLRKTNEADGSSEADGEKDKDEGRTKPLKANKEEDDKMRTTAANVAARVAVGGDDMLSKWQLMAEQARQKREGVDSASAIPQIGKDITRKPSSTTERTSRETQDSESRSPSIAAASGAMRKFGRNPVVMPHTKVVRSVSVKDVIAVLEREPQMSKSTLVYRLHGRIHADAPTSE